MGHSITSSVMSHLTRRVGWFPALYLPPRIHPSVIVHDRGRRETL